MIPAIVLAATLPAAATSAYGAGQSYARLFQDVAMPGTCGIVLERERCRNDYRAVRQLRGSDPTDAMFVAWLADGDAALHTNDWDGAYVLEKTWSEDPSFAWWYTAGVISIAIGQPRSDAMSTYLGHFVDDLSRHPAAAPSGFQNIVPAAGTPFERAQPLQRALDAAVPPAPYPAPAFGTGYASAAQLGVYVSTLQELVDNPWALSRPESRLFADAVLTELQRRHAEYSDGLNVAGLQRAVSAEIPTDPQQLNATWRDPLSKEVLNTKWPEDQRNPCLLGLLVAQVAYNSAVLKDPNSDASFRTVIAQIPAWAGMSSTLRTDLSELHGIPLAAQGGSWQAINKAATKATLDLASAR